MNKSSLLSWKTTLDNNLKIYWLPITIIFCSTNLCAQEKKLAIFAPKNSFALTLIEQQLYQLKNDTDGNIFEKNEIVNINDLLSTYKDQKASTLALEQLVMLNRNNVDTSSVEEDAAIKELGNRIKNSKQFLRINCYDFGNFIEFQFLLYNTIKGGVHMLNIEEKSFATRIFSNNNTTSDLKRIIDNALKELFFQHHTIPRAKIHVDESRLNGKTRKGGDSLYAAVGDTIFLDAFYSIDSDTPSEFLHYGWRNIIPNGAPPNLDLELINNGMNCKIIPNIDGKYEIELSISDGVNRLNDHKEIKLSKDTILIIAKVKPQFLITKKELDSYSIQCMTKDSLVISSKKSIVLLPGGSKVQVSNKGFGLKSMHSNLSQSISNKFDTLLAIDITYPNKNGKIDIPIRVSLSDFGIYSEDNIVINHKLYFPYYIGLFRSQSTLLITPLANMEQGSHLWNETKAFVFFKIIPRFDVGIGWAFKKESWKTNQDEVYSLSSAGEIDLSWKIIQKKNANLKLNAFGKTFQIEEPNFKYTQLVGGLYCQINAMLFQGLSELSLNLAMWETPFSKDFILEYNHWWGLGLKLYFINPN